MIFQIKMHENTCRMFSQSIYKKYCDLNNNLLAIKFYTCYNLIIERGFRMYRDFTIQFKKDRAATK